MAETGQKYTTDAGYMTMATNYGLDGYYDYPSNTIATITYATT